MGQKNVYPTQLIMRLFSHLFSGLMELKINMESDLITGKTDPEKKLFNLYQDNNESKQIMDKDEKRRSTIISRNLKQKESQKTHTYMTME